MVDISVETITRILYGPDITPQARLGKLEYRMRERHNQRGWLAQVLTDGQPSWLENTNERIVKCTLTFAAKFLWAVVQLRLVLTRGDNTFAKDRMVLVASLMSGFSLNRRAIIIEEINYRAMKLSASLPFPCLITRLCREAHVPILAGIDMKTYAKKNGQTIRATNTTTEPVGRAIGVELVFHVAPIPTSTPYTSGATTTQSGVESTNMMSYIPLSSKYAFTPPNFARVVRKADRQEKQFKLFAEKLGFFVDRAITVSLEPYKNLHACMDEMEERVNNRMKYLTVPELSRFVAELKKAQEDILKMK
ncbi:hypothetical protein HAX54_051072 [Datura stramonium]|uniref:Putative plant transposon protein domain-containing protein n=1 Tax=Datura stramonium TaxID=4076 RepID=A0ABS8WQU2_DATST|nr:hypothetical protein [Datura stramonium]